MTVTSANTPYRTVRSGGGRAIHLTANDSRDLNAATLCGRAAGCEVTTSAPMTTCGHCARRAGVAKGETIHAEPTATREQTDAPTDERADERPTVSAAEAIHAAPARAMPEPLVSGYAEAVHAAVYVRQSTGRASGSEASPATQRDAGRAEAERRGPRPSSSIRTSTNRRSTTSNGPTLNACSRTVAPDAETSSSSTT